MAARNIFRAQVNFQTKHYFCKNNIDKHLNKTLHNANENQKYNFAPPNETCLFPTVSGVTDATNVSTN